MALQHLLALLREAKTAFLTFRMRRGPLIVLGREQCELAEPDLLASHGIPSAVSPNLVLEDIDHPSPPRLDATAPLRSSLPQTRSELPGQCRRESS